MTATRLSINALAHTLHLSAVGLEGAYHVTLTNNQLAFDKKVHLQLPRDLFPFIKSGEAVVVSLTIVRVGVEEEPAPAINSLILPGEH